MSEPTLQEIDFQASNADDTQVLARTGEFGVRENPLPQWEFVARDRIAAALARFTRPLTELVERGANEGDTRFLVTDFLSEGLNYDKYSSLTTEYRTGGESVDYGIAIDGELFAFIEVKPCGQELDGRNLLQAKRQAAEEGLEWVILTNGSVWQVHHITCGDTVASELVLEVDLLAEGTAQTCVDMLFHVSKEGVQHGRLERLRQWRGHLETEPLARALLADPVVDAIRAELRRTTGHAGHIGDADEIARALRARIVPPAALARSDRPDHDGRDHVDPGADDAG